MERFSVAFLLANWYSGATLLTLLADRHPGIISNGEGFYHPGSADVVCSCGNTVRECAFYRRVGAPMWRGDDFDRELFAVTPRFASAPLLDRLLRSTRWPGRWRKRFSGLLPGTRDRYGEFVRRHLDFMEAATAAKSARVYLDGTKSLRRAEMFLSEPAHAASPLLLLVREPLSWCASWREKETAGDIRHAVRTWSEYIRRGHLLRRRFPAAPFMVLRYEDLCARPVETLKRITDLLGVSPASDTLLTPAAPDEEHHILGNSMRLSFDGRVKAARSRATELSPAEQALVRARCAPWMDRLGYD